MSLSFSSSSFTPFLSLLSVTCQNLKLQLLDQHIWENRAISKQRVQDVLAGVDWQRTNLQGINQDGRHIGNQNILEVI